jgi:ABC-type nitrate/sulfonate/bicarbonate transport system ATPase subunit
MKLEIENIVKSFRGAPPVLRGVDLVVEQGQFVSLIGHSGCGKTTLINVIAGLTDADSGRVLADGQPITGPGPDRAMVFQQYSLLPRLSLVANVREATSAAHPEWRSDKVVEVTERYLTAVGLWEHKDKRPHEVSGGMKQRAAVARAFAVSPRVLLLDEPFGALDALTRARLQDQLIDLWAHESSTETVLMVTHGIDEAIALADRIVVMGTAPGPSILDDVAVTMKRPRDRAAMVDQKEFRELHQHLVRLLQSEVVAA